MTKYEATFMYMKTPKANHYSLYYLNEVKKKLRETLEYAKTFPVNNESYRYSQQSTMVLQTILKFPVLHRTRKKIVLCTKSNSKYIKDPNVRSETLNLLGETKGKCSKIQTLERPF